MSVSSSETSPSVSPSTFVAEMDQLSLEQALRDVEVANSRAVDLTRRLLEANEHVRTLETRIASLRYRSLIFERPLGVVKRSRLGSVLKKIRNRLRALGA